MMRLPLLAVLAATVLDACGPSSGGAGRNGAPVAGNGGAPGAAPTRALSTPPQTAVLSPTGQPSTRAQGNAPSGTASLADSPAPVIIVDAPSDGLVTSGDVSVSGHIDGGAPPFELSVVGTTVPVSAGHFAALLAVADGDRTLAFEVVDAAGRHATAQRTVAVDRTRPFLEVTRPAGGAAQVSESPYLVEGNVGDAHLASVTVGGIQAVVIAGAFSAAVPLHLGANDVVVVARDVAGNVSETTVRLTTATVPPSVQVVEPADGAEAIEALASVRVRVEASAPIAGVTISSGPAAESSPGEWTARVPLALGENKISVVATDTAGGRGTASVLVRYRDASKEPLSVTGVEPAPDATGVPPDSLVNVAFNKAIDPASLAGNVKLLGKNGALPARFYVAPGAQLVSVIAEGPLPQGERIVLSIAGVSSATGPGMAEAFTSAFATRPPHRTLRGTLLDLSFEAVAGALVEVEGTAVSTRSDRDGNYHLVDLPEGLSVLRIAGGSAAGGGALATVRRRVYVDRTGDVEVPTLFLAEVDGASTEWVDATRPARLRFADRHPGLSVALEENGMFFGDGRTGGFVTATRIPPWAVPVPLAGRATLDGVWQIGPAGIQVTKPVTLSLPNVSGIPPGRLAVILTYDRVRHVMDRTAVGRVTADGTAIAATAPVALGALELVGYMPLDEAMHAKLESLLQQGGSSPAAPPAGSTGFRQAPEESLGAWLSRLVLAPFGGVARAQIPFAGLFGIPLDLMDSAAVPVEVNGRVWAVFEKAVSIELGKPAANLLGKEQRVDATNGYSLPIEFTVRGGDARDAITAELHAFEGERAIVAPAAAQWMTSGTGTAALRTAVPIPLGAALSSAKVIRIELAGNSARDRRRTVLEATLSRLPASGVAPDDDPPGSAYVRVAKTYETDSLVKPFAVFPNQPLSIIVERPFLTSTDETGGFSAMIPLTAGWAPGGVVCADIDLGTRLVSAQTTTTAGGEPRIELVPRSSRFPVCEATGRLEADYPARVNLTVDLRVLLGKLRFVDRSGQPIGGACDPNAVTEYDPQTGDLASISPADVEQTEIHFFRDDDRKNPIARYAVAVPRGAPGGVDAQCAAASSEVRASLGHAWYSRLRLGPSNRSVAQNVQYCAELKNRLPTISETERATYYRGCANQRDGVRLTTGDRLVIVAVNHATGYTGYATVTVPPVMHVPGADGSIGTRCALDDQYGPLKFAQFGREWEISRCTQPDARIEADVDLFPPEIDVRVTRKVRDDGMAVAQATRLVRTGGAANVRDDAVQVETNWRVRPTAPKPPPGAPAPAPVTAEILSPENAGSVVDGRDFSVRVRASDPAGGVRQVAFYVNGGSTPVDVVFRSEGKSGKPNEFVGRVRAPIVAGGASPAALALRAVALGTSGRIGNSNEITVSVVKGGAGPSAPAASVTGALVDNPLAPDSPVSPGYPRNAPLEDYCTPADMGSRPSCVSDRELVPVPEGVPPLAGHLLRVTGTAVERPALAVFPIPAGTNRTVNVQLAQQVQGANGVESFQNSVAYYYVHAVGNPLVSHDLNGDGTIDPSELKRKPPDFSEGDGSVGSVHVPHRTAGFWGGLPARAIALKNVYVAAERGGETARFYDRAFEHEFRVVDLQKRDLAAVGPGDRTLDAKTYFASPDDVSYSYLMALLSPQGTSRAGIGGMSDWVFRVGTETWGIDCKVDVVATAGGPQTLSGNCGGESLEDVLSASDLLYLDLALAGNVTNALYRFNLAGVSPPRGYVSVSRADLSEAATRRQGSTDPPQRDTVGRPVTEPALASFFVSPAEVRRGTVRLCLEEACTGDSKLKEFAIELASNGAYTVSDPVAAPDHTPGASGFIEFPVQQTTAVGANGARQFLVPLPPHIVALPPLSRFDAKKVLIQLVDESGRRLPTRSIGVPVGTWRPYHVAAAGQTTVAGVNLANGGVSFRHEDLAVPEYASMVRFERTYDNENHEPSPMGVGWTHNWEGFVVEERLGRYTVVLAGQAYDFPSCSVTDKGSRTASSCRTDLSHRARLEVQAGERVVFTAEDGRRYHFDRLSQRSKRIALALDGGRQIPEGRRRWVLTSIDDRYDAADEQGNPLGVTRLLYDDGSDRVRHVERRPGKVALDFEYEAFDPDDPNVAPWLKQLARSEDFKRLKRVKFSFVGGAEIESVEFDHGPTGNLIAARQMPADGDEAERWPARTWRYTYLDRRTDLLGGDTWEGLKDGERRAFSSQVKQVEQFLRARADPKDGGKLQSRASYLRDVVDPKQVRDYLTKYEIVSRVILPGQDDVPITFFYEGAIRRVLVPNGDAAKVETTYELNAHGSVKTAKVTGAVRPTTVAWRNDAQTIASEAYGDVSVRDISTPTGRRTGFDWVYDGDGRRSRPKVTLAGREPNGSRVAGVAEGDLLSDVVEEHRTFGVPTSVNRPSQWGITRPYVQTTGIDGTTGEVLSVAARAADGRTASAITYEYAPAGGIKQYTEWLAEGSSRKHEFSAPNAFGQMTVEDVSLIGGAAQVRRTLQRTLVYDSLGRLTSVTDDAGASETWTYDGAGRVRAHSIGGAPAERWTWEYAEGDNELVVTERLAVDPSRPEAIPHERRSVYRDGRLKTETVAYDDGKTSTRTFTWRNGRLVESTLLEGNRKVTTTVALNRRGLVDSLTVADGTWTRTIAYGYDDEGRRTSVTDQNGLTATVSTHDDLGRPSSWNYGASDVQTVVRDASGAITAQAVMTPDGPRHQIAATLDPLGVTSVGGHGVETALERDGAGRLSHRWDAIAGLDERWEYDVLDRVSKYTRTAAVGEGARALVEQRRYEDGVSPGVNRLTITRTIDTGVAQPAQRVETETLTIDSRGRVLTMIETVGEQTARWSFAYDERGNLVTRAGPVPGAWRYDPLGHLVASTDPAGKTTTYAVDSSGRVWRQAGPHPEAIWTFEFDGTGQLVKKTLGLYSWSYEYLGGGRVQETDPRLFKTTRTFDAAQRLVKEERAGAGEPFTTTYAYEGDYATQRASTQGSESAWKHVVTITQDDRGRELSRIEEQTVAGAPAFTYTTKTPWDRRSTSVAESWTAGGHTQARVGTLETDALGNVVRRTYGTSGAAVDSWTYDAVGLRVRESLAGRHERTWEYSGPVPMVERFGPEGAVETTTYAYFPDGRPQTVTEPSGRTRSFTWDPRGLVSTDAYGANVWSYRYDDAGALRSATHGSSTWQYAHGPRGELTSVTQPDGTVFTYGRNELAELSSIAVRTAAGNPAEAVPSRTFEYDHLGRETRRTRGTTVWTTSWAVGRGTTTISAGSDQVSLVLDGRGRVLARAFVNGPESVAGHTSIAYAYNGLGELMQTVEQGVDGTATTVFKHDDPRGLLTRIEREGAPAVVYGRRPTSGAVESVTVGSSSVTYGFDGFGRVSSIDGDAGRVSVGWEPGGARIESLSGGGLHERRCYDGAGRLTEVLNATSAVLCGAVGPEIVAGYVYRYQGDAGARGNRTSETVYTEGAAPQTTSFGYDAADRLTGVQYADRAVLYRLAADGTRLAEKTAPDVADLGPAGWASMVGTTEHVAYHYDGRGGLTSLTDELSGGTAIATWSVDAAGRVTSETRGGTTKTYGWDAEGRLREVTLAPPTPALPYTVSYAYDHAGRRVRKSGPGGVSTYLWGADELVTETPAGGSTVVYQRLGEAVVGIGGERVLHDGLGSVVGRATYGVATQYRYDAWGAFRGDARPRAGVPSAAYAGQHWDQDLGLSYAQQRWYEPRTGRFLSEDPVFGDVRNPVSLHAFGYGGANPLRYTDPEGTCIWDGCVVEGIALAGIIGAEAALIYQELTHPGASASVAAQHAKNTSGACLAAIGDNFALEDADLSTKSQTYSDWYRNCDWGTNLRDFKPYQPFKRAVLRNERLSAGLGGAMAVMSTLHPNGHKGVGQFPGMMGQSFDFIQPGAQLGTAVFLGIEGGIDASRTGRQLGQAVADATPEWQAVTPGGRVRGMPEEVPPGQQVPLNIEARANPGKAPSPGAAAKQRASVRAQMRDAGLHGLPGGRAGSQVGPFRFRPPKGHRPGNPLPLGPNGGYLDRFGNEWVEGPYHGDPSKGFSREWDVQLSKAGKAHFKQFGLGEKGYINVAPDGTLSH